MSRVTRSKRGAASRFKVGTDAQGRKTLKGFASTFEPASNHDSHGEVIGAHAYDDFTKAFAAGEAQLLMMDHHKMDAPIGRWTVAEVREAEGKKGLWVEGYLTRASDGQDMALKIEDEVVTGLSVHFEAFEQHSRMLDQKTPWGDQVRQWDKVTPFEVSPVGIGSNHEALIESFKSRQGAPVRRSLRASRRPMRRRKGIQLRSALLTALIASKDVGLPDLYMYAWDVSDSTGLGFDTVLDIVGGYIEPRAEHLQALANHSGVDVATLEAALNADMGGGSTEAPEPVAESKQAETEAKGEQLAMKLGESIEMVLGEFDDATREDVIEALTEGTGLDAETVEGLIAGEDREVTAEHLVDMAEILGVSAAWLIKGALEDGMVLDGLEADMSEDEIAAALAEMMSSDDMGAEEAMDVAEAKLKGAFAKALRALS